MIPSTLCSVPLSLEVLGQFANQIDASGRYKLIKDFTSKCRIVYFACRITDETPIHN